MAFPYLVKSWFVEKHLRRVGYLKIGDIGYWKKGFWIVERLVDDYPLIKIYLRNLKTNEQFKNWYDWEYPIFQIVYHKQPKKRRKRK